MENQNYGLWGGVTVGIVAIVLGLMWYVGNSPVPQPGANISMPPLTASDWQEGPSTAPGASPALLTLVEYSDFQCPACALYYPLVKRLKGEYASTTIFVYRHFPLPQHLDAKLASYAAEAAGMQGKFFEMHDILFEKQKEWGIDTKVLPTDPSEMTPAMRSVLEPKLIGYAKALGLDIAKFTLDMASKEVAERIEKATTEAKQIGVPATPTFFLNGRQLQFTSPNPYDEIKKLMDDTLKKS